MLNSVLLALIFLAICGVIYCLVKLTAIVRNAPEEVQAQEVKPGVTSANPAFVTDYEQPPEASAIIMPKSPQLVEWEEEQELLKMNMGKPR